MTRQTRLRLNKVYAGISDFSRNLGLVLVGGILVDLLINPARVVPGDRLMLSMGIGLALFGFSLILAWMQKE